MRKKAGSGDKVHFFNVSLVNANVMSVPRFPQPQRLIGELIHSVEAASPRFAWVQFLFQRVNYSPTLVALKNAMYYAVERIKTPKTSLIDDSEYDRAELHRDWYKRSTVRIKRIDAMVNKPHVLLAIQGMWVGDPRLLSSLPFKDCHDELDRLGLFVYRNPWMLAELVGRRMVEDVSSYVMSFAHSRLEPPSFLITQEEVPCYLHMPVAKQMAFLGSIRWKQHSPDVDEGEVEGGEPKATAADSRVLRLRKVPWISEPLKDTGTERLSLLPSLSVRGFELLFENGRTELLLSSRSEQDMHDYSRVLGSVYGELDVVEASPRPDFLKEIPRFVGLKRNSG